MARGDTRQEVVGGVVYVLPRSESAPMWVRKVGPFGVGVSIRWTSWGVGFDILRAGLLIAVGPAFIWIAHIERQLGERPREGATGARIAGGERRISAPVADEIAPHKAAS